MANLGINNNLIGWTQLFLSNRLIELVIGRFTNPKQKVEIEIPQGLPVFPILFLIYINWVFSIIEVRLLNIIYILFVDDQDYLTSDYFINKIVKLLKK